MRRTIPIAVAVLAAIVAPGAAAESRFTPCDSSPVLECASVAVPLDRFGGIPGELSLHIRRERAKPGRGVVLFLAGGPGQASAQILPLVMDEMRRLFPGYTVAASDQRGSGDSSPLYCPAFDDASVIDWDDVDDFAERCAEEIGPVRAAFTTMEAAEDLEAVRNALGAERVVLYGTSYGTKLALAYAAAHPDRVERLLLDSVLPVSAPDPFSRNTLRAIPTVLTALCRGGLCRHVTPNAAADFVTLANRLADEPDPEVRAEDLLDIMLASDMDDALRAAIPAAVRSAVLGDTAPLLRLQRLLNGDYLSAWGETFSAPLFATTTCEDVTFPWSRGTRPTGNEDVWRAAAAGLDPGEYGPLGRWALTAHSFTRVCLRWPQSPVVPATPAGPLPDVPTLALAGELDLRTPFEDATTTAAAFPQGRVVVVPHVGHSVLLSDSTGCSGAAVATWLAGSAPKACRASPPPIAPAWRAPRSLAELEPRGHPGRRGRTLTAVAATLHDALLAIRLAGLDVRGPEGGTITTTRRGFALHRYSFVPGVWVTGTVSFEGLVPARLDGTVTVGGKAAAAGTLQAGKTLRGRLDGVAVRAGRRP
jgi:pimeloyl-ACP methyl ester carboxylesterase